MRAPSTITSAKWHVLQACLDLYWAVIDAAHAILISQGEAPLSPIHIAKTMSEYAKKGKIKKSHARVVDEFYQLSKAIVTRDIKEISGADTRLELRMNKIAGEAQGLVNWLIKKNKSVPKVENVEQHLSNMRAQQAIKKSSFKLKPA